jgi:hypothetical protein
MTAEMMMNLYNALSASHLYILGFMVQNILYYALMDFGTLARYMKIDRASEARGGFAKLRIKLTRTQKAELLRMATQCGTVEDLAKMDKYNKGENFERIITELLTGEKWVKDSVPFNVAGDIVVNGENIQIKFDGAEITNERLLKKLTAR